MGLLLEWPDPGRGATLTLSAGSGRSPSPSRFTTNSSCCCTPTNQLRSFSCNSGAGSVSPAAAPAAVIVVPRSCSASAARNTGASNRWVPEGTRPAPLDQADPSAFRFCAKVVCQGSSRPVPLSLLQPSFTRSGPTRSMSAFSRPQLPSSSVSPTSTAITTTANPGAAAWVGPVGGGGGGGGPWLRRRRIGRGRSPIWADISRVGSCIDQLAGRCRLGASSTSSSCLARRRRSLSRQRVSIRQVLSAFASCPCPIQAVTINMRMRAPSGSVIGCASARGSSSSRHWP